ncbi:merR family regulatory family protein [Asticcacaulis biprosthecium C19]|uniref:MerR family regulatory family protein n=1 Tax=Asticcacaulis biprosthecium C19 TaxID=715226 RepID=F4QR60_9CAUL|nr:MerR family transcriptional regulator [Asticcacaulis biprosthecium]EGF90697.1 merR family regulatory family protein [Asticcacaulis biprosthecium C19]
MNQAVRYLSPAETAKRLGVSGKALRVYETRGLVRPERTLAGWRVYGPDQLARLQQVIALKGFGLSLSRIAGLLSGRTADLDTFLALHAAMLQRQKAEVERALSLVTSAREQLARDGSLSSDDLIHLTKETLMTNPNAQSATYDQIAARHLTPEDQDLLAANGFAGMDKPHAGWEALIAEAGELIQTHATDSPEAMDLARRWMAQVAVATDGDPALNQKVRAVALDMLEQPGFEEASRTSHAMMDYISQAYGAAIAAGICPKP